MSAIQLLHPSAHLLLRKLKLPLDIRLWNGTTVMQAANPRLRVLAAQQREDGTSALPLTRDYLYGKNTGRTENS